MTIITIDKDRALELLEKAVEARGANYLYKDEFGQECVYVAYRLADLDDDGEARDGTSAVPACIAAEALVQADVDVPWELGESLPGLAGFAEEAEGYPAHYSDLDAFRDAGLHDLGESELEALDIELTEAATRVWWVAQRHQDNGETWGDALEAAREVGQLLGAAQ